VKLQALIMIGKWDHTGRLIGVVTAVALLCTALPALSQVHDDTGWQELTATAEDFQRYEAERRRQEQLQREAERRKQERLRFETEQLRQENERRKQEQLRLENERLRQEIERHEQEQLRLEIEQEERERAQAAIRREQSTRTDQGIGSDTYEQLLKIGQLRDDGILTEEEFQRLKRKILE
jgi:hypothetical protein